MNIAQQEYEYCSKGIWILVKKNMNIGQKEYEYFSKGI